MLGMRQRIAEQAKIARSKMTREERIFKARLLMLIGVPLFMPFIAIWALGVNLWNGLEYWWLDMRQEWGTVRRLWRDGQ